MKKLIIALFVIALIASSDGIYGCSFHTFSSDSNNVNTHRVTYSYQPQGQQKSEQDLIELHPGQSFYSLGTPGNIKVQVYANGDATNTRICDVYVTSQGDVDVRPETQRVSANITAQCPEATFNSKTCELKLIDKS